MPMDWGLARDYAARDGYPEEIPVTEAEWLGATDPGPNARAPSGHAVRSQIAAVRSRVLSEGHPPDRGARVPSGIRGRRGATGCLHGVGRNPGKTNKSRFIATVLHPEDAKEIVILETK
jgi:hypothetical protein